MKRLAAFALALAPLCALAGGSPAEVFNAAAPSVFSIGVITTTGESRTGSGVAVAPGKVVTNYHVVRGASKIFIKQGERSYAAVLEDSDEKRDLALLRNWDLRAPAASIGPAVGIGQTVFAIGSPRGLELSLSQGLVSSLRRTDDGALIQTTAPISPGSSGGGLFDEEGRLVGLTTAQMRSGQNLNFAVPVAWLRHVGVPVSVAEPQPAAVAPAAAPVERPAPVRPQAAKTTESAPAPGIKRTQQAQRLQAPGSRPQPVEDDGFGSAYFGFALVGIVLLLTKPAINWLTDFMSRDSAPSAAATQAAIRAVANDKFLPFRGQARAEIKADQKDQDTWLRAVEQTGGDETRALAAYIELRAQTLYRAELDRKWAEAQAQAQTPVRNPPPRV